MAEDEPIDKIQDPIWFREASNYKKKGPYPLDVIWEWYETSQLLPSDELSADDGQHWSSIVNLLRRNGPTFPFSSFDDGQPSGIEIAREMVSSVTSGVDRLESHMEMIVEQLEEEKRMIKKLRKMEKILDPDSVVSAEQSSEESDEEIDRVESPPPTQISTQSTPLKSISAENDELFGNMALQLSEYRSSLAEDTVEEVIEREEDSELPVECSSSTNLKADSSSSSTSLVKSSQKIQVIGAKSGGSIYAAVPRSLHPFGVPPMQLMQQGPCMVNHATHAAAMASQQHPQMMRGGGPGGLVVMQHPQAIPMQPMSPMMMQGCGPLPPIPRHDVYPGTIYYQHRPTMMVQHGPMASQGPNGFVQLSYPPNYPPSFPNGPWMAPPGAFPMGPGPMAPGHYTSFQLSQIGPQAAIFSMMGNPFTDIEKFATKSLKMFVDRMTVEKILRIDLNYRAFPLDGVYIFEVFHPIPVGPAANYSKVVERRESWRHILIDVFKKRNDSHFMALVSHLFVGKELRCVICDEWIANAVKLVEHIVDQSHMDKMHTGHLLYSVEGIAFWILVLRIAEDGAPWWRG